MNKGISAWLGQFPMFKSCSHDELEQLANLLLFKKVERKDALFYEGEPCDIIYFVKKGQVKVYKTTEDGREQIVNILTSGDMLPHVGLFGDSVYPATAEALDDTEVYYLYVKPFTTFISHNPSISIKLLQEMDEKIREIQARLSNVLNKDMREKILSVLLSLARSKGTQTDSGYQVDLELTHQDIADMVGTTRETASRILGQLKREGLIRMENHVISIKE